MTRRHLLLASLLAVALAAPARAETLQAFLQRQTGREPDPAVRYQSALVDLDGDRRDEAVVRILGPGYCGTGGCGLLILARQGESWRVVTDLAIAHAPIRVLATRSRGWRDLGVIVAGGGVIPGYEARLRFDGTSYPDNPSVPPAERLTRRAPGRELIGRDDRGRPLF